MSYFSSQLVSLDFVIEQILCVYGYSCIHRTADRAAIDGIVVRNGIRKWSNEVEKIISWMVRLFHPHISRSITLFRTYLRFLSGELRPFTLTRGHGQKFRAPLYAFVRVMTSLS